MVAKKSDLVENAVITYDPGCMFHSPKGSFLLSDLLISPTTISDALSHLSGNDRKAINSFVNLVRKHKVDNSSFFKDVEIARNNNPDIIYLFSLLDALVLKSSYQDVNDLLKNLDIERYVLEGSSSYTDTRGEISICVGLLKGWDSALKCFNAGMRTKVKSKFNAVRKVIDKLEKKSTKLRTSIKDAYEIQFWKAEYLKRRFASKLRDDRCVQCKAWTAYRYLMKVFNYNCMDQYCINCVFLRDGEALDDLGYLKRGVGCKPISCDNICWILKEIDKRIYLQAGEVGPFSFYNSEMLMSPSEGLDECVELTLEFGLYPTDLFAAACPEQLLSYKVENGYFPRPHLLPVRSELSLNQPDTDDKFNSTELHVGMYNDEVKNSGVKRYQKDRYEERLIGLWLWDEKFKEENHEVMFSELMFKLSECEWFNSLESFKMDQKILNAGRDETKKRVTGPDTKAVVDRFRRFFNRTKECVLAGDVLTLV